jgi:cytochrome c biogenesis protein CcmG, thiol:disulfide interchange protein DsbE
VWRYFVPAGAFLALGALLACALVRIGAGTLDVHEIKSPLIGRPAPAFRLPSVTEPARLIDSRSLAGQKYVLNVWGTWCGGCREEHSALLTIARTAGVPLIGIDWKDERELAVRYLAELGNPYQQVASDADGRVAIDWGVYGAPETFLVSESGTVLVKHIGPLTASAWQQKFVPHLAAGGAR